MAQEIRIFVPRETSAVSLGADEIAARIGQHIERKRLDATVVRNGSWGMCWLEPLVEVQFEDQRVAYGPVIPEVLDELLAADLLGAGEHDLRLGSTTDIPYLQQQDRWTFRRVGLIDPLSLDDYRANGGFAGITRAFEIGPAAILQEVANSGLRGRGGAAFPTGI